MKSKNEETARQAGGIKRLLAENVNKRCDTMKNFSLLDEYLDKPNDCHIRYFRHEPTGMKIVHCYAPRKKENNFDFAFKTFSNDSTGIAHATEHLVLLGNKKYPFKNSYFLMKNHSLNSSLNAETSLLYTDFYGGSPLKSDFYTLIDFMGNAVFFPLFRQMDFYNEVWHPEIDADGNKNINGVVYNEIKDSENSEIIETLFKDTFCAKMSGGDISELPNLKLSDIVSYHKKFYVPANCLLILNGNIPFEEELDFLEKNLLSNLPSGTKEIEFPQVYRKFDDESFEVLVPADEDSKDETHSCEILFNSKNENENFAQFDELDFANVYLFRKIDKFKEKFPNFDLSGDSLDYFGGHFSQLIINGDSENEVDEIKNKFFAFLEDKTDTEFDKNLVSDNKKWINNLQTAHSVDRTRNILESWIDKNDPMDFYKFLKFRPGFLAQVKNKDESYFRALFEKYILKNKNRVTLYIKADKSKSKKREDKIKKSLDDTFSQFSDEEILELNKNLKEWQKPDFDEEEKIRNLFKFDFDLIPKEIEKVEGGIKKIETKNGTFPLLQVAVETKNICSGRICFSIEKLLPQEIACLEFLRVLLNRKAGYISKKHDDFFSFGDLSFMAENDEINSENPFGKRNFWKISLDAFHTGDFLDFMEMLVLYIKNFDDEVLGDKKIMDDFIEDARKNNPVKDKIPDVNPVECYYQVLMNFIPTEAFETPVTTVARCNYFSNWLTRSNEEIIKDARAIWQKIKDGGIAFIFYGEKSFLESAVPVLKKFAEKTELKPLSPKKQPDLKPFIDFAEKNGFYSSSKYSAFVQKSENCACLGVPCPGVSKKEEIALVLYSIFLNPILQQKIRTENNAYSVFAGTNCGVFYVISENNPDSEKAVEEFESCLEEAVSYNFTSDDLNKAIKQSNLAELATRTSEDAAEYFITDCLADITQKELDESNQYYREMTPEDLHKAAVKVASNLDKKRACIITGKKTDEKYEILNN